MITSVRFWFSNDLLNIDFIAFKVCLFQWKFILMSQTSSWHYMFPPEVLCNMWSVHYLVHLEWQRVMVSIKQLTSLLGEHCQDLCVLFLLFTQLTSIVRRKLSNSRAVQMLLKFGWWFSTVVSNLSNQASLSSALAHTSGLSAIFSKDTHLRDNSSPGEPATSFTCKNIYC